MVAASASSISPQKSLSRSVVRRGTTSAPSRKTPALRARIQAEMPSTPRWYEAPMAGIQLACSTRCIGSGPPPSAAPVATPWTIMPTSTASAAATDDGHAP